MVRKTGKRARRPEGEPLLDQSRHLMRGLKARKGLGQHFLVDEGVLADIVGAAGLDTNDIVIEVGPGLGMLTRELAKKAGCVVAVEIDGKLASRLARTLGDPPNLVIVNGDILKLDPSALVSLAREKAPAGLGPGYKVVANLPYYITSPVLRHFLTAGERPRKMVVMVQREVAEAIAATPGGMSILAVSVQFYGRPQIVRYVPAKAFHPVPEVESAVLAIDVYPHPAVAADDPSFFKLVRAGFSAARKQLPNSLAQGLGIPKEQAMTMLGEAGIEATRRAEALSLDEWAVLWQVWQKDR